MRQHAYNNRMQRRWARRRAMRRYAFNSYQPRYGYGAGGNAARGQGYGYRPAPGYYGRRCGHGGGQIMGTLLGGAAGGFIGNQIGSGRGNRIATAAGALIGLLAGNAIGRSADCY